MNTEQWLSEVLNLNSQIEDLQQSINANIREARKSPDYEEYKESLESYYTLTSSEQRE